MSFNFTITMNDASNALSAQEAAACVANLRGAMEIYARHFTGLGTIDVVLDIKAEGSLGSGRSPTAVTVSTLPDGRTLAEGGANAELRTGNDPNGVTADIELTLPVDYLRKVLWLDPDPTTRAATVPAGKFDAVSFFLHELGHGFGFNGYGDEDGDVSGNFVTTYDALVQDQNGHPVFVGAEATAAYGRPVPLSTGEINNYLHYGRTGADGVDASLMEGSTYSPAGFRWYLDKLDLAFFRDLGIQTVNSPIADVGGARFQGFGGNDSYVGGVGNDTIDGGSGDNTVMGGAGNDSLSAGSGSNYIRGEDGDDRIVGGIGFDDIHGNTGNDTANGGFGNDWVVGGKDHDVLFGDAGDDLVYGNLGNDTVHGGDGDDIVRGGQGDDTMTGGAGNDFMAGDRGADTMTGGIGADVFHTHGDAGLDRVLDFSLLEGDRVNVAPGTAYMAHQVGADTVIDMTGGGQMVLVGVQFASLTPGWIFGA